ncbi:MAG: metal ABC transporter ATP-binding protein [Ignavibacteriaceae bacterium]|jgi:ABC-type Mn/Zn transport systems, ATPase component|nr:MAG: metal ABC transporter ATP-binding protein [Chlorobiota bacterium]KXK03796.1 MAG: Zinc transport system ATP-binding protein [Chlorobi bacterium OLB4]MBV6398164.1 High-affinity zinc uptake system ATP-binding protein ZnuC [Ignavibacteria bacterium]MCC6885925.1 metal ABC transporter ATP-binding protein [Ignavibacteriales bacterium]MCE7953418.1 metal ABC transporter ATP-binding protein [Chlorobi bacterium CHB7]MDL1887354.1 metal ABC transporter ATP-binding protein [Ignavibacteria bacterium 
MIAISAKNLTVSYNRKPAIKGINLNIKSGRVIGIVGPNGAGKSTLMKAMLGLLPVDTGEVKFFDKPIDSCRKKISYIPQREQFDWDFPINVTELVMMGRYAHIARFGFPNNNDKQIVNRALEKVGMYDYRKRQIRFLSGGQQQRIFLARSLAQESEIYFMDEPFVGVDAKTEMAIFELLKELREAGKTILVVHHDLAKVKDYFDNLILINQTLIAYGETNDIFTRENIERAYGGKLTILQKTEELVN